MTVVTERLIDDRNRAWVPQIDANVIWHMKRHFPELYVRGETLPWPYTSGAVEAAGDDVLTLEPAPAQNGG